MAFKQFAWVPDGTWEHQTFLCRYTIVDGNAKHVVSKMWIDQGGPAEGPDDLRQPWGTYPPMPPKPPK